MCDIITNGKKHQDDYNRIKKTIQEIVEMSKSKTSAKATKSKKKKQEPEDRNENLFKQFFELQKFQKNLSAAMLGDRNKHNSKKMARPKGPELSEGYDYEKGSLSSSSNSRTVVNKSVTKERTKREEYNTDELSDKMSSDDPERVRGDVTEGTDSGESDVDIASYKSDNESIDCLGLGVSGKSETDSSSVEPIKKKSVLSPSELAIIKDLCRDLIKKEEKPPEEIPQKPELLEKETKQEELNSNEEVCSEKEDLIKIEHKIVEIQEYIMQPENVEDEKHYIKTNTQNDNIETEDIKNRETKQKIENIPVLKGVNVESNIDDSASNKETPRSKMKQNINELTEYEEDSKKEFINALLVNGKLMVISEHKEETITTDEKFKKVHLEILTKETVEEVDEWKQRKTWSEEKLVIEKTVKVNGEDKEITEAAVEPNDEATTEIALSNMSDDDLIRKTIMDMEQIDQEFLIEKAPPVDDHGHYNYEGVDDGHRKRLEERIDRLQEQIFSLRVQLEEAKRKNEEEAKEVEYLSSMMAGGGSSLLRSGLDWGEWELKQMVRERLEQKRLAAMQEYQARLRMVEALCCAEMGKLEESLQTLLPLNATVSTWDTAAEPVGQSSRSSWQTQDYVFEVVTSMNLSSSDDNGASGTISTNGEQPSLTEWKAEGQ